MIIYGTDRFYIYGIEQIIKQLPKERSATGPDDPPFIYVTSGLDIHEMYSLFFRHPPVHHSVFITSERYFDSLSVLFPGLTKLCLSEALGPEALQQALHVMSLLSDQNPSEGYSPDIFKFTRAEQHIMQLVLQGHSLEAIARIRGVSPSTVSVQRNILMKRTGTKSLQELYSLYAAMQNHVRGTGIGAKRRGFPAF